MFHWTRRMPNSRTWSFLANQSFLRKTIKRSKVVSSSNSSLTKKFLWSRGFCFEHPCRKRLPQIRNFFLQNQKRMSNLLFLGEKNPFVSKPLSGPIKCGVHNSANIVSPRSRQIIAPCPKVKKFWFLAKSSPRSAQLCCIRRKPSWVSFEVSADEKVADVTPLACPFSKNWKLLAKSQWKD